MKVKIYPLLVLGLVVFSAELKINAQNTIPKQIYCEPTTAEILFAINPVDNWSPSIKGILVAGEFMTTGILKLPEESLLMTQLTAMVGGIPKNSSQTVYLLRESEGNKTRKKQEVNLDDIKTGRTKDIKLKTGDIVFLPRGCADGKLLTSTKRSVPFPQLIPRGVDLPIRYDNQRTGKHS